MNQPYLSPDDLPSNLTIQLSEILFRQLEEATKKNFFLAGDRITRILLSSCHWYFKINSGILILIMICPDLESYQNIMRTVPQFTDMLKRFTNRGRITVSPPADKGIPWVLSIDEILPEEDSPTT
ncbi:hypothetical protein COO91_00584 [Nostoc flagelliforme CCNUN1]|uniref:Uncharacterized protein n=1 Tax=Nostoc flagelliforme CCNUN1 TaxID=2038116 RepID=A0A2K8SIU5_9NOSO|nr:hypothetical protein [Nostoc flagelliforme]AUB34755.1 hypothetical protein COO91_00584 [Nostoc flagelliforme CCNUN1]